MNGTTDIPKEDKFVRTPQWFFRQFLPNARSLTQVKIVAEIINQTRGYQKPEDVSTLTHLAKTMNMSRSAVSAHLQVLLDAGIIRMRNEQAKELNNPIIRKLSGNQRLKTVFAIPTKLNLTEDMLQLLRTKRKDLPVVLSKGKNLSNYATTSRPNIGHNNRYNSKDNKSKESNSAASQHHSPSLVTPSKNKIKECLFWGKVIQTKQDFFFFYNHNCCYKCWNTM